MDLDPISKLARDIKAATAELTPSEARYLVDSYYEIQEYRKAAHNQVRALTTSEEPCEIIQWLGDQMETLENQIKRVLDGYTNSLEVGRWMKGITGIGPVLSAGLLAHIDIDKAPTVGHIWRFAGLDPTTKWEKGQKRPWNARLKVLCWKIGESFVKTCNNDKSFYGPIYQERKLLEIQRNEAGQFADQAAAVLQSKKIGKDTEAYAWYSQGKLPPAHLHARACRYAVKLFLSHLHEVWYKEHFHVAPPAPYPIAHMGHVDKITPPLTPLAAVKVMGSACQE